MATSAFKSTSRRSSIRAADDSCSSSDKPHRRSRSLSRFSRRQLEEPAAADYKAAPKGKFVNTVRGSEILEISLDDLAIEFFSSKDTSGGSNVEEEKVSRDRGRSRSVRRGGPEIGRWASDTASSMRRGSSASRNGSGGGEAKTAVSDGIGGKKGNLEANSRRRRSVSVARYQMTDSESEADHFRSSSGRSDIKNIDKWKSPSLSSQKISALGDQRLRKSLSHKDLASIHDGYSSHSSALTDDETKDAHLGENGNEKTIQAVYAQNRVEHPNEDVRSGLYEAMRKELRYAVEEIRTELEQVVVRNEAVLENDKCLPSDKSDALRAFSAIKKNYATKLEQSQKRKQDLLAEMMLEEQRGRELSKIVREILPDSNNSAVEKKSSRTRKSSDKNRMSKRLTEEAEKCIEDFISNIEDADISSFDGERSDASSSLGGLKKMRDSTHDLPENFQSPVGSSPCPAGTDDGVIFPWLQWETSNDGFLLEKTKSRTPVTPKSLQWDAEQDTATRQDPSNYSVSSQGSWNPGLINGHYSSDKVDNGQKCRDTGSMQRSCFDMSEYLMRQRNEEALFEMYNQHHQIGSGGLLLCANIFL